ncbi:MAG: hypothetical protein C0432_04595 [Candidatus Puniceispirillum sp.]|nr:hypothetical protein [Candidatus Pelagibacter sp.]MBA4283555.1 hypothetical protein [Candidatus Puniceispirillum sp.]
MKKKNTIQSIISKREKMNFKNNMFDTNENPEQEMSMDEILASIRRYVDPHHEDSVKPHTLSNITVGHTDTLNHSGSNADRIQGQEHRSSDHVTIRQPKNEVPANQQYREEKKSFQDTTTMHSSDILKSAPLKEFLKAPSEDRDEDVVRLTSQQNDQRTDYNTSVSRPNNTDYTSAPQPTVAAPLHTTLKPEEDQSSDYYKAEIISQETQKQVRHSFSKLEETLQKKQLPPKKEETSGNITIDDMFRQLAIPMIKSWIDQNMPTMVEALIEKEIKKITGNN